MDWIGLFYMDCNGLTDFFYPSKSIFIQTIHFATPIIYDKLLFNDTIYVKRKSLTQ